MSFREFKIYVLKNETVTLCYKSENLILPNRLHLTPIQYDSLSISS